MNRSKIKKIVVLLIVLAFALTMTACDTNGIEDELSNGNEENDELIKETVSDVEGLVSILEKLETEDKVLIEFEDGDYEENINIHEDYNFSKLTLISENPHGATIKQQPGERGIEIHNSSNITISGFKIIGDNENLDEKVGVGIWYSENIDINNNHIKDFPFQGIYIHDSQVNIEYNLINNNKDGGIRISNSIEESTIMKNSIINNSLGVQIDNSDAYIYDNFISENDEVAILITNSIADVIDNYIGDSFQGIYISHSEGDIKSEEITISGNYFDLLELNDIGIKYYYIGFDPNYEGDLETIKNANEYEQNIDNVGIYNPDDNPDIIAILTD